MIGTWELVAILVVVVLVFGTKKLRSVGEDLGAAVKGFKSGMKDGSADSKQVEASKQSIDGQTIEGEIKEKTKS